MSLEYLIASLQRAASQKACSTLPTAKLPTERAAAAVNTGANSRQKPAK